MTDTPKTDALLSQIQQYIAALEDTKKKDSATYHEKSSRTTPSPQFILEYMIQLNEKVLRYFEKLKEINHGETLQVVENIIASFIDEPSNEDINKMAEALIRELSKNKLEILKPLEDEYTHAQLIALLFRMSPLVLMLAAAVVAFVGSPVVSLILAAAATLTFILTQIFNTTSELYSKYSQLEWNHLPSLPSDSETYSLTLIDNDQIADNHITINRTTRLEAPTKYIYGLFFEKNSVTNKSLSEEVQEQYEQSRVVPD